MCPWGRRRRTTCVIYIVLCLFYSFICSLLRCSLQYITRFFPHKQHIITLRTLPLTEIQNKILNSFKPGMHIKKLYKHWYHKRLGEYRYLQSEFLCSLCHFLSDIPLLLTQGNLCLLCLFREGHQESEVTILPFCWIRQPM